MPNLFRLPVFQSSTDEDGWKTRNGEKHVFINAEGVAKISLVSGYDQTDNGLRITYKKSTQQATDYGGGNYSSGNYFATITWFYQFTFNSATGNVSIPQSEIQRLKQVIKKANKKPLSMPIFELENQGNIELIRKPALLTIKQIESAYELASGGGGGVCSIGGDDGGDDGGKDLGKG